MKEDLDKLAAVNPNFHVHYTLTRVTKDKDWGKAENETAGRVDWSMLKGANFPEPADDVFYIACGTPDFNKAVGSILKEAGFTQGTHYM